MAISTTGRASWRLRLQAAGASTHRPGAAPESKTRWRQRVRRRVWATHWMSSTGCAARYRPYRSCTRGRAGRQGSAAVSSAGFSPGVKAPASTRWRVLRARRLRRPSSWGGSSCGVECAGHRVWWVMRHHGLPSPAGWAIPEATCQRRLVGTILDGSSVGWSPTGCRLLVVCHSIRLPQSRQRLAWAMRSRRLGLSVATCRARLRCGAVGLPSQWRPVEAWVGRMGVKVPVDAPRQWRAHGSGPPVGPSRGNRKAMTRSHVLVS